MHSKRIIVGECFSSTPMAKGLLFLRFGYMFSGHPLEPNVGISKIIKRVNYTFPKPIIANDKYGIQFLNHLEHNGPLIIISITSFP